VAKHKVSLWNFWNHIPCAHTALREDMHTCPCDGRHILMWRQTLLFFRWDWTERKNVCTWQSIFFCGL